MRAKIQFDITRNEGELAETHIEIDTLFLLINFNRECNSFFNRDSGAFAGLDHKTIKRIYLWMLEEANPEFKKINKCLNTKLIELDFSVRAWNCLEKLNINTLGELAVKEPKELLALKSLGKKTLYELKDKLAQYGLQLGLKPNQSAISIFKELE
jgi:DNA-directed RNA polymerase alpha subunit